MYALSVPHICILVEDQYKPCGCWVTSDRLIALLMQRNFIIMKIMKQTKIFKGWKVKDDRG